jgi:hypothetical protein
VAYPDASEEARVLSHVQGGFDARHLDAIDFETLDPDV